MESPLPPQTAIIEVYANNLRVRACKLLGIDKIWYTKTTYTAEDLSNEYPKDVKDLIESNLKQRVAGNSNPIKLGKCIVFLEGYYGIRSGSHNQKGNNRIGEPNNSADQITQDDLANDLGISTDTLRNYKQLATMIPEIQDLIETGIVTPTTARPIIKQLSENDQRELASPSVGNKSKSELWIPVMPSMN